MEATATQLAAKPTDYLGWWVGLAVGCQMGFWCTVAYIVLVQWGHPHLDFTTADYVAAAWLALQLVLASAGFVRWGFSFWQRRWFRGLVWLGLTVILAAVTYLSFGLLMIITGVAGTSVGEPPPGSPEREESDRLDRRLNFAPAGHLFTKGVLKPVNGTSFYLIP